MAVPRQADPTRYADPLDWLGERAAGREAAGLRRRLAPRLPGEDVLDLAGNDYLGLSRHPAVVEAGVRALRTWGAGSTGSRLVTGSTTLHAELEDTLAAHTGAAAALVFATGYAANLGALTALAGAGDLVVSDAANHASLVDACRLSRAEVVVVPHADVSAVAAALAGRAPGRRALVVTDSVFSVDGDVAPLAGLYEVCRRYGAVLLVDEAHALGVVGAGGRGALAAAGLAGAPGVVATASLAKALGSQGGVVVGPAAVRAHLVDAARTFIFDTGLAPACAGAALGALRELTARPELADACRQRAAALAAGLAGVGRSTPAQGGRPTPAQGGRPAPAQGGRPTPAQGGRPMPAAAVVPVVLGDPRRAVAAAAACRAEGVRVGCFRPPSVPPGTSRLRLAARADLTGADVDRAVAAVRRATARA